MVKKVEVTETYLRKILDALEDAKGLCVVYGFKNDYQKLIYTTKKQLEKIG